MALWYIEQWEKFKYLPKRAFKLKQKTFFIFFFNSAWVPKIFSGLWKRGANVIGGIDIEIGDWDTCCTSVLGMK